MWTAVQTHAKWWSSQHKGQQSFLLYLTVETIKMSMTCVGYYKDMHLWNGESIDIAKSYQKTLSMKISKKDWSF